MKKSIVFFIVLVAAAWSIDLFTYCKWEKKDDTPPVDSLTVGLVAYYSFNGNSFDISGNENNGLAYNTTAGIDRNGNDNSCYHFDGVSSYVRVPDNKLLRLSNTDYTINAWVKLDAFSSAFSSAILSKRDGSINLGYYLGITGTGAAATGSVGFGPGGTAPGITSTGTISLNKWYMITIVYNVSKQQVTVYKNGIFDSTVSNISSPGATQPADIYIGADNPATGNSYFLKGFLDDIRIYNRRLSSTDITNLYYSPI